MSATAPGASRNAAPGSPGRATAAGRVAQDPVDLNHHLDVLAADRELFRVELGGHDPGDLVEVVGELFRRHVVAVWVHTQVEANSARFVKSPANM